jgi:hypothetical protein
LDTDILGIDSGQSFNVLQHCIQSVLLEVTAVVFFKIGATVCALTSAIGVEKYGDDTAIGKRLSVTAGEETVAGARTPRNQDDTWVRLIWIERSGIDNGRVKFDTSTRIGNPDFFQGPAGNGNVYKYETI